MGDITIRLRVGPSSSDQYDLLVSAERPVADLITDWKKVYRLAEQDRQGEMIRYALYRDFRSDKAQIDPTRSLRSSHVQPYQVLYLADERSPWWQAGASAFKTAPLKTPGTSVARPPPGPSASPSESTRAPAAPWSAVVMPCSIEIAPGCVRQVSESGLVINREYLLHELPPSVQARERALVLIGLESRLGAVSRGAPGHCSLLWRQSWYLIAHSPIYIGSAKYSHDDAIQIEQTLTVLLGREGWPMTIRLLSTCTSR